MRSRIHSFITCCLLGVSAFSLAGCSVYDGRYQFTPKPAEVVVYSKDQNQSSGVRTLVSVIGVRRAQKDKGEPASVEVAVRVENQTGKPIVFVPTRLQLIAGDLNEFGPPQLSSADQVQIDPEKSWSSHVRFAFPTEVARDRVDLDGLNLKWTVVIEGHLTTSSVSFTRRVVYSDGGYWYGGPYYSHGFYRHRYSSYGRWRCW